MSEAAQATACGVSRVRRLFLDGLDSQDIANILDVPECDIWNALVRGDKAPLGPAITPREKALALIEEVALRHRVTVADIRGPRRLRPIMAARFDAYVAVANGCRDWTVSQIAQLFNRHPTALIHYFQTRSLPLPGASRLADNTSAQPCQEFEAVKPDRQEHQSLRPVPKQRSTECVVQSSRQPVQFNQVEIVP